MVKECLKPNRECPFCEAGVPRKVIHTIYDYSTGESLLLTLDEDSELNKMLSKTNKPIFLKEDI